MARDRIIHRLYAVYSSVPFTLLFPPLLLGLLYFYAYLGHLVALIALSVFLIIESRSPVVRLLLLIVMPVILLGFLFGTAASPAMLAWLAACGVRVAGAKL